MNQRLDAKVALEFRKELIDLINKGNPLIVLKLDNVNFIDSSGLGAIVSCLKALGQGGKLVI